MGGLSGTPGHVTITPIYWAPSGYSFTSKYKSVIDGYLSNVAAASHANGNVFSVADQYYQRFNGGALQHIDYAVTAGSEVDVTNAYPLPAPVNSNGCIPEPGLDGSLNTACVADGNLQTEINATLSARHLTTDDSHLYMVFFPPGVETCSGPGAGSTGQACSSNVYCGYHSGFGNTESNTALYANDPYPALDGCGDPYNGPQAPNIDPNADAAVSVISHEANEAITDSYHTWIDANGNEDGDECAYTYGVPLGGSLASGTAYNQTINGAHYFTQDEFSNTDFAAGQGDVTTPYDGFRDGSGIAVAGCIQRPTVPLAVSTVSLPSGATGQAYTASLAASGGAAPYTWSLASGSLPGSLQLNPSTGAITGTPTAAGTTNFTVRVTDTKSHTAIQALSLTITPIGLVLTGVTPTRVCDTRPSSYTGITDTCSGHRLVQGAPLVIGLPPAVVPAAAGAVVANVTVVGPAAAGYLSAYPTGGAAPASSNLNFTTNQTVANLVTVATGTSGGDASISVIVGSGTAPTTADVIVDVEGYDAAPGASPAGGFHPLPPGRDADTRCAATPQPGTCATEGIPPVNAGAGTIGPRSQDHLTVTGLHGVPATGVSAVAVNLTAVYPSASGGYMTVVPGGTTIPSGGATSSTLNFNAGQVLANKVIVPVAADGTISVYNYAGSTDAVVDVDGWYSSATGPVGSTFTPVAPLRLADTRCAGASAPAYCPSENLPAANAADAAPGGGQSITVGVGGTGTVPSGIDAAVLDVVDVAPGAANFLSVYPAGSALPATSDVNWSPTNAYNIVPGASIATTGTNAAINIYNGPPPTASANVIADLFGYYTPPT